MTRHRRHTEETRQDSSLHRAYETPRVNARTSIQPHVSQRRSRSESSEGVRARLREDAGRLRCLKGRMRRRYHRELRKNGGNLCLVQLRPHCVLPTGPGILP
ncbi:hypothetical protein AAFF_G00385000 [Aldrovandia affinis]|uniref:Uncharacterized protein n=1 Tax=Aldrovandia affinis TaxID=143900 RepID=A0AAD7SF35_9TELE|nr:hypothetical protein AAFF_G00385000 [Aldrovandia affinis]